MRACVFVLVVYSSLWVTGRGHLFFVLFVVPLHASRGQCLSSCLSFGQSALLNDDARGPHQWWG